MNGLLTLGAPDRESLRSYQGGLWTSSQDWCFDGTHRGVICSFSSVWSRRSGSWSRRSQRHPGRKGRRRRRRRRRRREGSLAPSTSFRETLCTWGVATVRCHAFNLASRRVCAVSPKFPDLGLSRTS